MLCIARVRRPSTLRRRGRRTSEAGAGAGCHGGRLLGRRPLAGQLPGPRLRGPTDRRRGARRLGLSVSETTSRGCTHMTRHEDPIYRIITVCTRVRKCRACVVQARRWGRRARPRRLQGPAGRSLALEAPPIAQSLAPSAARRRRPRKGHCSSPDQAGGWSADAVSFALALSLPCSHSLSQALCHTAYSARRWLWLCAVGLGRRLVGVGAGTGESSP